MTIFQVSQHLATNLIRSSLSDPARVQRALSNTAQLSCLTGLRQRQIPRLGAWQSANAVPGRCYAALLSREAKEKLVSGVGREHVDLVAKILDQASSVAQQWSVAHTDFLTPPARSDAMIAINRLADVACMTSGGYAEAERCRLSLGNAEAIQMAIPEAEGGGYPGAVAALKVSGPFSYDSCSHGDFLGAVLGCGIAREKVGDILVQARGNTGVAQGEGGAHILVAAEVADYLCSGAFHQVRNVAVVVDRVPLGEVEIKPPKVDVLRSVEASLRVDAVASAGFKMSRTKLGEMISGGSVRVNWKDITKAGVVLKTGDVVSVRGKGRLVIGEISMTKKGKYAVEITRYI